MGSSLYLFFLFSIFYFESVSSLLFMSSNSSSSPTLCHHDESLALIRFKNSFSICAPDSYSYYHPYRKTETWKEGTDCCMWDGVKCDIQTGFVIELNLSNYVLSGPLHSNNTLFFLPHLQKLDLSFNEFQGSEISSEFGKFSYLTHLNLRYSDFYGEVPSEISHLCNLVSLDFSWNFDLSLDTTTFSRLTKNLTKLRKLDLSETNMSLVSPDSFFNLSSSLLSLRLCNCHLRGKFPASDNFPNLISLDLSGNENLILESFNSFKLEEINLSFINMSFVSPNSFFNLSSLSSLRLCNCDLRGKFSVSVHFPNLISLDLSANDKLILETFSPFNLEVIDLSRVNMSLVSPDSFLNLSSSLSSLSLQSCGLRGKFPSTILQRPNLLYLDLYGNPNITGFLPTGNWSKSLSSLDLSYTQILIYLQPGFQSNLNSLESLSLSGCNFIGSNLAFLSNFTRLTELSLSHNYFSGQIPSSIGNLVNLISLDLSYNNFSGQIPSSIGNLVNLISLYLSYNNFSGQIPSFLGNLEQLTSLYIDNNLLSGPIPNSLGNLTQLEYLYSSNNRLTGPIPSQLGNLTQLMNLFLSNNLLSETMPFSLFTLPSLQALKLHNNLLIGQIHQFQYDYSMLNYIDLSYNKLHGPIPSSIFKIVSMEYLILSSNDKLTGTLSSSICQLQELRLLDLSNNSLNGPIPNCMGHFSNALEVLHLGINSFDGIVPPSFSKGNNLRYLNFYSNELQGPIPSSIINCQNLEVLDLGHNNIIDTFPFFLGSLPELKVLVLRHNMLHGPVTNFNLNYSFPKLQIFDPSNNYLSGPLPSDYFDHFKAMMMMQSDIYITYMGSQNTTGYDYSVELTLKGFEIKLVKIQTILALIDFSHNKFTGEIPKSIGKLKGLVLLNLSHNCLTGTIQPSLGNLINLESLDLSSNALVGRIPLQLLELKFLEVFQVSYNHLEGLIPTGNQFNTFNTPSYEGNPGLCGFPLEKECENGESQPSKEDDILSEYGFGWEAVLAGYGCGVIFGFAVGCVIFRIRKFSWFVSMVEVEGYLWRKKFDKFKNNSRSHRRRSS